MTNPAARDAAALIRAAANFAKDPDPVVRADARTSQCDARAALCIAKGVALEDIDPTTGYDYSAAAYERARTQWRWHAGQHGLDDNTRRWLAEALADWTARRPDLADGDDWLTGVKVTCGDCGAVVPVIDSFKEARYDRTVRPPRLIEQYDQCATCAENGA